MSVDGIVILLFLFLAFLVEGLQALGLGRWPFERTEPRLSFRGVLQERLVTLSLVFGVFALARASYRDEIVVAFVASVPLMIGSTLVIWTIRKGAGG